MKFQRHPLNMIPLLPPGLKTTLSETAYAKLVGLSPSFLPFGWKSGHLLLAVYGIGPCPAEAE